MNLSFLGDALDHWKGSLLDSLQRANRLHSLSVDPMASDLGSWKPEDIAVYSKLLRVDQGQIIRHKAALGDRSKYFGEVPQDGDLFLDPDTGVATYDVRDHSRYVKPAELGRLLDRSPGRLIAVYQHVRGQRVRQRVGDVLRLLKSEIDGLSWCSYESPSVAMIFLTREAGRSEQVAEYFQGLLGRHASSRVWG